MKLASGYNPQLSYAINNRDFPPAVPDAMDDEFNDGSFNTSLWTWLDQGSWTVSESTERVTFNGPAADGNRIRGVYQTLPTAPCAFEAKIYIPAARFGAGTLSCLFMAENTTGVVVGQTWWGDQNAIRGLTWTTPSSAAGTLGDSVTTLQLLDLPYFYARMEWDGTDYLIAYSVNPNGGWSEQHTVSPGFTPTLIGLGFGNFNSPGSQNSFGWFRRVL